MCNKTTKAMSAVVWGARGHFHVLAPLIVAKGVSIATVLDSDPNLQISYTGTYIQGDEAINTWLTKYNYVYPDNFVLAFGGTLGKARLQCAEKLLQLGLAPLQLIHQRAWVADTAQLGDGVQILAMAAVCEYAAIGDYTIINTHATVDHESKIGQAVHIMPGATVTGCVTINDGAMIGSNATILPGVTIGADAVVGAGAVVTRDVPAGDKVVGNPAKKMNA